jgi:membrane associated rhomboid family serine protease
MLAIGDSNPVKHIRLAYVNYAYIFLCVAVFISNPRIEHYALYPGAVTAALTGTGAWMNDFTAAEVVMQLVTYGFLHSDVVHLATNMIVLWVFGNNIEDAMGHLRYVFFFILCAVGGGLAEAMLTEIPSVPVVGASGAIAGVMGAYLILHPRARILVLIAFRFPIIVPASLFVGLTVAVDVMMAFTPNDGGELIAWWAHIGGFVAGLALIPLFKYRDVPLFQSADAYPEIAFPRVNRFLIDLSPKRRPDGAATLSGRVVAGLKAVIFLIAIIVIVELFVGG